jgi:hypothetical protein
MKTIKVINKEGHPWNEGIIKTTKNYIKDRLMDEDLKNNEEVVNNFKAFEIIEPEEVTIDNAFGIDTSRESIDSYVKDELEKCKDIKHFYAVYMVKRELTDEEDNLLTMYLNNLSK